MRDHHDTGPLPYFPARLGTPVHREKPGQVNGRIDAQYYEAWRESFTIEPHSWSERSEAEAFAELLRGTSGFRVILGEPGSGKTRLLEEWFRRWRAELPPSMTYGMRVPVLISLRHVAKSNRDLTPYLTDDTPAGGFADRLRCLAGIPAGPPVLDRVGLYRQERARLFWPVWLLDGLDELPPCAPLADWLGAFAKLPGHVVATCRTAVWQAEQASSGNTRIQRVETILPLRSNADRAEYLRPVLGGDAERLAALLGRHAALSPLAGNPLLLDRAAQLWREDPGSLPASRAEFYRRAVANLWKRKVDKAVLDRTRHRDRVLERLAARMGLAPEAEKGVLEDCFDAAGVADAAVLLNGFRASGLLWIDDGREAVSFLHLTFQEYFLSASLALESAVAAVERHWEDARYEEVLALLLARLAADGRLEEVSAALSWLVRRSEEHAADPSVLHRIRRSPMRVALHLVSRSGLAVAMLGEGWLAIDAAISSGSACAYAVAHDEYAPAAALERLAYDCDEGVRWAAAGNPSTPAAALGRLARDPDGEVRREAAGNPSMPAAVLEQLAGDSNDGVRRDVARNLFTPAAALDQLAGDPDAGVRREAVRNPSMPAAALERLAHNPDGEVRREAVRNPSMPAAALERLAHNPDGEVRREAVRNPSMPAVALERLADDPDYWTRQWAAGNQSTPAAVLERLASDPDAGVRREAARNPFTPAAALMRLASDPDVGVRQWAAGNPSTPAAALERLEREPDNWMRQEAAWNSSTPAAALERLAGDPDAWMRRVVAGNPSTPAILLERLAADPDEEVRVAAAGNPSILVTALERLSRDPDEKVRRAAAWNLSMSPMVLERLARDPDYEVRWAAVWNPSILLECLVNIQTE